MRSSLALGLTAFLVLMATACADRRDAAAGFLDEAWPAYLERYVHPDGYVLDPRRDGGRVTSEGQGYALLRAVWERDEATFRRLADWTREELQRPDGLHSWLWTPEDGGRIVDPNTATDGDMEIAWALLMAADVFGDQALRARGAEIVRAVRTGTAIAVAPEPSDGTTGTGPSDATGHGPGPGAPQRGHGPWFPAAGDWGVEDRIANLSYFVPYAHPWFQAVDPEGGWDRVTDVGYTLLRRWLEDPEHRLPPAFFRLGTDGQPLPLGPDTELETEFSFDAIRLYWRLEADCRLRRADEACADPLDVRGTLALLSDGTGLASSYAMDGARLNEDGSSTFYAALLPAARRLAPELAGGILEPHLDRSALAGVLAAGNRYYDHNWVWFGLALDRGIIEDRTPVPPGR